MPPEHEQLEADWLASELFRCQEYARKAYETKEEPTRQLYLANLIGTLVSLHNHYRYEAESEPAKVDWKKRLLG